MSEVFLELQRNGNYLKCTAIDSVSGEEAVAIGPFNDPESVKRLAVQKLRLKLEGKKPGQPPKKPGISV
ncbi:MAG: hypothetical protein JF571_14400 [Asticcacaulis sp.]|nr:hypothetical protein [Asticcacaulis sp.]